MELNFERVVLLVIAAALLWLVMRQRQQSDNTSDIEAAAKREQEVESLQQSISQLRENLSDRLESNNDRFIQSLQRQSKQNQDIIGDITKNLTEIKESNKRVLGVSDELKTIQNILTNPKQRGVLGEYYLEALLQNVLPPDRYQMQYKFKSGEMVDAAIFLDKGKVLPVDSKFSLENYNRLIETDAGHDRDQIIKKFKSDLKARIDETAKYIRPDEDTMDFAFMFIPSEAIYYDLLVNKVGSAQTSSVDLIEYAFKERQVIIVSPTSFMAYLQTVMQGLRSLRIEEQAKHIQKQVKKLGMHFDRHNTYMLKVGKSLSTTVNHYNAAHKELAKMDKDVNSITGDGQSTINPDAVDRPLLED